MLSRGVDIYKDYWCYSKHMKDPPGPRQFATTHWGLVGAAKANEASQTRAREAFMNSDTLIGIPSTPSCAAVGIQRWTPRTFRKPFLP